MSAFKDLTGKRFGKLIVIERIGTAKSGHALWLCQCDCGNTKLISSNQLRLTKSCGCFQREMAREKSQNRIFDKKTKRSKCEDIRLHRIWTDMKKRCYNKNCKNAKTYYYRNIKVCDEWRYSFANFYNWAINNGYKDNLTIDRIDVNGNYEPINCRWTDIKTQNNNRTNNRIVFYDNKKMTLKQLAEMYKINYKKLSYYLNAYKDLDFAIKKAGTNGT